MLSLNQVNQIVHLVQLVHSQDRIKHRHVNFVNQDHLPIKVVNPFVKDVWLVNSRFLVVKLNVRFVPLVNSKVVLKRLLVPTVNSDHSHRLKEAKTALDAQLVSIKINQAQPFVSHVQLVRLLLLKMLIHVNHVHLVNSAIKLDSLNVIHAHSDNINQLVVKLNVSIVHQETLLESLVLLLVKIVQLDTSLQSMEQVNALHAQVEHRNPKVVNPVVHLVLQVNTHHQLLRHLVHNVQLVNLPQQMEHHHVVNVWLEHLFQ